MPVYAVTYYLPESRLYVRANSPEAALEHVEGVMTLYDIIDKGTLVYRDVPVRVDDRPCIAPRQLDCTVVQAET